MDLSSWCSALDAMKQSVDTYIEHANHLYLTVAGQGHDSTAPTMSIEEGLLHVDSKLAMLSEIEQRLRASRVHMKNIRNNSVNLTPIARLPTEILSIVVMIGHNNSKTEWQVRGSKDQDEDEHQLFRQGYTYLETKKLDIPHFPTIFSHVCHRWREISLNTSAAWTHVELGSGSGLECAAEWIKRSGQAGLAFKFSTVDLEGSFRQALETVGSRALQTTSLAIDVITDTQLLDVLRHFTAYNSIPPIKRLSLSTTAITQIGEDNFPGNQWEVLTGILARLEDVRISQISMHLENPVFRRLKNLQLAEMRISGMWGGMFCKCTELESLHFNHVNLLGSTSGSLRYLPDITLPKLRAVSLLEISSLATYAILSPLSAPALEKFTISCYYTEITGAFQPQSTSLSSSLLAFLKTATGSLKTLCVYDCSSGANWYLDQILAHNPELERLSAFGHTAVNEALLTAICRPQVAVPKLKSLWLKQGSFSAHSLKNIIQERNFPGSERPIEDLLVQGCGVGGAPSTLPETLKEKVEKLGWVANWDPEVNAGDDGDE